MNENLYNTILDCVVLSLFKENNINLNIDDISCVLTEAAHQTVFPIVYSAICDEVNLSAYQAQYYSIISQNIKITEEHKKIHKLLDENNIPYVFLKGCASAKYYPDPLLRTMGDVDILISPEDTEKVDKLLLSAGYTKYDDAKDLGSHIGYRSKSGIACELHRRINGIPQTEVGDKISALFPDIFEKSVLENGEYRCPCDFHHGLILLLHTAAHLTHEGIGLRHLCDWAVFIANFSDKEFLDTFEKPLRDIGLWKFAKLLSACAVKHLGCPAKSWIGDCDELVVDSIIEDIINGGNFGTKDFSRYQQIKYISDKNNREINSSHPLKQALNNIVSKAKKEFRFVQKYPFLLPFGCIAVLFKYLYLIITKKRKLDSKQVITDAMSRKSLYSEFQLFKSN